jgi:phage tail-like protein
MPNAAYQSNPYPIGQFIFEVDGMEIGTFQEVSGLSVDVEVEEIQEGGENQFVHKLPGRMTWPNIVLKRGMTKSDNLFSWLSESSGTGFSGKGDKLARRSAAVTMLAADGTRLRQWEFLDAFAVKWTGPSFDATSTDPATEELEIAHHGFTPTNVA